MKYDIIIVGAGVAGLMTTIELAQAGNNCCLIDRGKVGQESSWAGGGILSPLLPWTAPDDVNALAQWSQLHYPEYLHELHQHTGIDTEWQRSGYLVIDAELDQAPIQQWAEQYSQPVVFLDHKQIHKQAPYLAPHFKHAVWMENIGQVRNPRLLKALHQRVLQLDQTILEDSTVEQLRITQDAISGVQLNHGELEASQVLITAGAWSGQTLFEDIQMPPIKPVKGQMIQYQWQAGEIKPITQVGEHYLIPRADGKLLVGSTLEDTGFDQSLDAAAARSLQAVAEQILPCLKGQSIINHWAGLRPGNERQIPYICQHPQLENLYFNTGHYRNGLALGLASARLAADLMLARVPIISPSPYRL